MTVQEKRTRNDRMLALHGPLHGTLRSFEAVLNSHTHSNKIRESFLDLPDSEAIHRKFIRDWSNGLKHTLYDNFGISLRKLGKSLYILEKRNGVLDPQLKRQAVTLIQDEKMQIGVRQDIRTYHASLPFAVALHDVALEMYIDQKERREKRLVLGGGAVSLLALATLGIHGYLETQSQKQIDQSTPTSALSSEPTLSQHIPSILTPTNQEKVIPPTEQRAPDAGSEWSALVNRFRLTDKLPSGMIPIRQPGIILDTTTLPLNETPEIQQALVSYLQRYNMFSNGKASFGIGTGGETTVSSIITHDGLNLIIQDKSPIPIKNISYDLSSQMCTISYTDQNGDNQQMQTILSPDDPFKVCIFSATTRKQTIGAIRLNDQGMPEVFIVITSPQ